MAARKTIRLLDEHDSFLFWTDTEDARTKLQSGAWEEVFDFTSGDMRRHFLGIRKIATDRGSDGPTPCALTAHDAQAAVGATNGVKLKIEDEVVTLLPDPAEKRAAKDRIFAWGKRVGYVDERGIHHAPKAVTISAGRVHQPEKHKPFKLPELEPAGTFA